VLKVGDRSFTGMSLFWCSLVGLAITGLIVWITEYYTGTGLSPGQGGGPGFGHRPRHQRHRGPRDVDGGDAPCRHC
jgi:hypothetical protein